MYEDERERMERDAEPTIENAQKENAEPTVENTQEVMAEPTTEDVQEVVIEPTIEDTQESAVEPTIEPASSVAIEEATEVEDAQTEPEIEEVQNMQMEPEIEAGQKVQAEVVSQPQVAKTQDYEYEETRHQTDFTNRAVYERKPEAEPVQMQGKKKRSWAAKAAGITGAAVLFGFVAGVTMFAVNTVGEIAKGELFPQKVVEQTEIKASLAVPETEAADSVPASSAISYGTADVSEIVEAAMPSVVAINSTVLYQQQYWFGQSQTVEASSSGSGIIVGQNAEELLIVTNNHVVEDSNALTITFIDGQQAEAAIKGTDSDSDLAVVAVPLNLISEETLDQIKIATIGDSDALKVGQGVIAIGNALGYGQSVTVGYVSALNREVSTEDGTTRTLLQTDAAINPGNSGGALLNMRGELIGINAAKYSSTTVEGMGYAIPISQAQDIINELMNRKTRVEVAEDRQGYLGIQLQNVDENMSAMFHMPQGVFIYKIVEGSAAANSDLRESDIITKFEGQTIKTAKDLQEMLRYYEGGDTVTITVQSPETNQYVERNVEVTLGFRDQAVSEN